MQEFNEFMEKLMTLIREYWTHIDDSMRQYIIPEIHFVIRNAELDQIAKDYIPNYEDESLLICVSALRMDLPFTDYYDPTAMEDFYNTNDVSFFVYNDRVEASFDREIVSDDTDMPTLLDVLRECYIQKTAKPVMKLS